MVYTPDGAKNALLLAAGLVFTTAINMVGVKTMARINNFGSPPSRPASRY